MHFMSGVYMTMEERCNALYEVLRIGVALMILLQSTADAEVSCPWKACSTGITAQKCKSVGVMSESCCVEDSDIIGVDLTNCTDIATISANFFTSKLTNVTKLRWISLSIGTLSESHFNIESLRSMTHLQHLDVSAVSFNKSCPPFGHAWQSQFVKDATRTCDKPIPQCPTYQCPKKDSKTNNTVCVEDGPGMVACACANSYYGYKCLRTGTFPFAIFFSLLVAFTAILSTFLWFTQRRFVKTKTN